MTSSDRRWCMSSGGASWAGGPGGTLVGRGSGEFPPDLWRQTADVNAMALAIMAHQPTDPSAFDSSSTTRKTVKGGISGSPIERGRYI